jgi:excisionase family DNA binding protein
MPIQVEGVTYVTAQEAAEEVDVSRQTIWRWRKDRKIPGGYRYRNGQLLFSRQELDAIRRYANRLQPSEAADAGQTMIFDE